MMWPSELMEKIADSILVNLSHHDLDAAKRTRSEIKTEIVEIIAKGILDNNFVLMQKRANSEIKTEIFEIIKEILDNNFVLIQKRINSEIKGDR